MTNSPKNTEALFNFRDRFCCLQLTVSMILNNSLQDSTSSLYPLVANDIAEQLKLKNLYYLPNSVIKLSDSHVLNNLIALTLGPLEDLSYVVMSNEFATYLVNTSGKPTAQAEVQLILGNSNYHCAFAPTSDYFSFTEQKSLTKLSKEAQLSISEQQNLGLLTHCIASNQDDRDTIQTCLVNSSLSDSAKADQLITIFSAIELPHSVGQQHHGARTISPETASIIANYLVMDNVSELTTFLGVNIYSASW